MSAIKEKCCNICDNTLSVLFKTKILNKYDVKYWKCGTCSFIQTDDPYWLDEAYENAMTLLDVGLISRNLYYSEILPNFLESLSGPNDSYLDYGGGYGIFVRMMRDKGFDFYLFDTYAENLFAKHFTLEHFNKKKKFAVLTTFEVFEHLQNPKEELTKMIEFSDTIIFSTELQPPKSLNCPNDWWYFAPETGQHISFYSQESLQTLAQILGLVFYTNGSHLHMFSKIKTIANPFVKKESRQKLLTWLYYGIKNRLQKSTRTSFLENDYEYYKNQLRKVQNN